jgi:hypothetical protein
MKTPSNTNPKDWSKSAAQSAIDGDGPMKDVLISRGELMQQFNVGDAIKISVTDDRLCAGHQITATIASILSPWMHRPIDIDYQLSTAEFYLYGSSPSLSWHVKSCYWESRTSKLAIAVERANGDIDFERFTATIELVEAAPSHGELLQKIENLEQQLIAAHWKIQSLEAGKWIEPPPMDIETTHSPRESR